MEYSEFISMFNDGGATVPAHTSGTTGTPKAVRLLKSDMRLSARATNEFFGIDGGSVLAIPLSADYIAGKMMAVRALEAECRLLSITPGNDFELPEGVNVSLLAIVPSQIDALERHPEWTSRVRNVLVGGAPPSEEALRRLCGMGYTVFVSYGMTETCSHVALARGDDRRRVFEAMPGISFGCDSRGCLTVNAPDRSFGSLQTNDVVDLIDDRHFRWLGRADNVINSGGIKIHPEQIEAAIAALLPHLDFYIGGEPDGKWGTRAVLYYEDGDPAAIAAAIEKAVPDRRLRPKALVKRHIRRTASGKIRR